MRKLGIFLAFFTSLLTINIATAEEVKNNGFNLIVVGDSQPQTKKQLTELGCYNSTN